MSSSKYKSREIAEVYVIIIASWIQLIYICWVIWLYFLEMNFVWFFENIYQRNFDFNIYILLNSKKDFCYKYLWKVHVNVILGHVIIFIILNIKFSKFGLRISNYNGKKYIMIHRILTIRVIIMVKYHQWTMNRFK